MNCVILAILFVVGMACQDCTLACAQSESVVVHQETAVTLTPTEHLLTGESTITYAPGTRNMSVKISPSAIISSISIFGKKSPFAFSGGTLAVEIPQQPGDTTVGVTISYRAYFNDPLPQRPGSSEDPTYGVTGAITAQGTFLMAGAGWYPEPADIPQKRITTITAPAGTEAVTAGKRLSRQTTGNVSRSVWEETHPLGGLALCAGPYRIAESRSGDLPIYTYFYPENAALADRYLEAAARYLNYYRGLFGSYPFEKFAVVENFFPTGYGFPSFTLLGSSIIRLPFIVDTSLPHEIAHSWWGNAVQVDQSEGNWAEGLVTYLADYLLKERRSADEAREYRMQLLSDYVSLVPSASDFPLSHFVSRVDPPSRAIGYGKSAMVFHMIRSEIGDRPFFNALQEIFRERRGRSTAWSDFERAFSRSSGRDLSTVMGQWLHRTGGARFAFAQVSRHRTETGWTVSGTILQTPPLYEVSLPLRLYTGGAAVQQLIPVFRESTPFSIATASEPERLTIDPDAELFRLLAGDEIPATVNSIKGSPRLVAVVTRDCAAKVGTLSQLLESLGKRNVPLMSEDEYVTAPYQNHDVLFCGTPQQQSLLPPLPAGVVYDGARFSVNGTTTEAPDGLLFLVLPFSEPSGRVAALFEPLSEAAAAKYTPKITHYGTFSTLLFSNGVIRHKNIMTPSTGTNTINFTGNK